MKLTQKSKRIIIFSSTSILVVALFVWYFFPVLLFKWFWFRYDDFRPYLNSIPVPIPELHEPPEKWEKISIADFAMIIIRQHLYANKYITVFHKTL